MPFAAVDGLRVYFEVHGHRGPPLLMMAPGGFDAAIRSWDSPRVVWGQIGVLDAFARDHTCIFYDRRESGRSQGRVEPISWTAYAREAKGLLDHLGIPRVRVLGACMGCSVAVALASAFPASVEAMVLHWPTGGARWRAEGLKRFAAHARYARRYGLKAVAGRAAAVNRRFPEGSPERRFWNNSAVGLWVSTLGHDPAFAEGFAALDAVSYATLFETMGEALFERDTVPGASARRLMALRMPALVIPGDDATHATSGARYLHECLASSIYHDVPASSQTPKLVRDWTLSFLAGLPEPGVPDLDARTRPVASGTGAA